MGELLEKYIEMSEGKQKGESKQTKAVETVSKPAQAQKQTAVSEDANSSAAPKSRGTKRNRYARNPIRFTHHA